MSGDAACGADWVLLTVDDASAQRAEREFIFHIAKHLNKYTTEMQN